MAGAGGAGRAATELFSVPESIVLAASASALPNNLSVLHPTAASKKVRTPRACVCPLCVIHARYRVPICVGVCLVSKSWGLV
jgi:hypothetical protein